MLIKEMRHSNQNIQNTYECFVERIQQISKLKKYSSLDLEFNFEYVEKEPIPDAGMGKNRS